MKKSILALSIIASLSACDIDNSAAKKVPAGFNNEYETEVRIDRSKVKGESFDIELTTGHGYAEGTFGVTDVNYGEANVDYSKIGEPTTPDATNPNDLRARTLNTQYGVFTIDYSAEGYSAWTYTLKAEGTDAEPIHADVQALFDEPMVGEQLKSVTDTVTLATLDGSTQTLNFIINAVATDSPADIYGGLVANASKQGDSAVVNGTVAIYDENLNESTFIDAANIKLTEGDEIGEGQAIGDPKYPDAVPAYGRFTIAADGKWEYKVNSKHEELAYLVLEEGQPEPEAKNETFKVYSADGTSQDFNVTITAAPKNFAALVPTSKDDKSILLVDLLKGAELGKEDVRSGKITFKVKVGSDLPKEANIGMGCTEWHSTYDPKRRLATFYTKASGEFSMWSSSLNAGGSYSNGDADYTRVTDNVIFDQSLTPDEWSLIEFTWEYEPTFVKTKLTLSVDGKKVSSDHGAIPVNPSEKFLSQNIGARDSFAGCLGQMRVEVQKDIDNDGVGGLLIDDIKYFKDIDADVKFDTPDFEEAYQNYKATDPVNTINDAHKALTTDNVLVVESVL